MPSPLHQIDSQEKALQLADSLAAVAPLPPGIILASGSVFHLIHGPGAGQLAELSAQNFLDRLSRGADPDAIIQSLFPDAPKGTLMINSRVTNQAAQDPIEFYGTWTGETSGVVNGKYWVSFPVRLPAEPRVDAFRVILRAEGERLQVVVTEMPHLDRKPQLDVLTGITLRHQELVHAPEVNRLIERERGNPRLRWRVIRQFLTSVNARLKAPIGFRLRGGNSVFAATTMTMQQFAELMNAAWNIAPCAHRKAAFYTYKAQPDHYLNLFDSAIETNSIVPHSVRMLWLAILLAAEPVGFGHGHSLAIKATLSPVAPAREWSRQQLLGLPGRCVLTFRENSGHETIAAHSRLRTLIETAALPDELRLDCLNILS